MIFTVLFAVVIVLWMLALTGVLDVTGAESSDGFLDGALEPFGLSDVPVTVVVSILAVLGWFVSVLAQIHLLSGISGTVLVVASVLVGVGAGGVGLGLAVVAAPVLGRVFETAEAPSGRDLVGRTAEIRSTSVSTTSGYADAHWGDGPVSRVEVRVSRHGDVADGELQSGDTVVLVDWDEPNNTYTVARLPADLA